MAKDKAKERARLLKELRQKKGSCRPRDAEKALDAWDFIPSGKEGNTQVWTYKGKYKAITLTLHAPHGKSGGNTLDPGAVAMVIRKIEEAELDQLAEQEKEEAPENVH